MRENNIHIFIESEGRIDDYNFKNFKTIILEPENYIIVESEYEELDGTNKKIGEVFYLKNKKLRRIEINGIKFKGEYNKHIYKKIGSKLK